MSFNIDIYDIPYIDPWQLILSLPKSKNIVFLDSAMQPSRHSRHSFIAYDPFSTVSLEKGHLKKDGIPQANSAKAILSEVLEEFSMPHIHNVPPFSGGVAGYFGYEFFTHLEPKICLSNIKEQQIPDFFVGLFDIVIVFDHTIKKSWICSTGLPETHKALREIRAKERRKELLGYLSTSNSVEFTAQYLTKNEIHSNTNYEYYCAGVRKVLDYIQAGDIYQANISQRFSCTLPGNLTPLGIYERLRRQNPAPFAAYLNLDNNIIASASPERFIQVRDRQVMTCPIKGTSVRSNNILEDKNLATSLFHCEKNRAENIMIVDLMRNDLSRVCTLGSVKVPRLCQVESYNHVHHLVSTVTGELKLDCNLFDLLAATFPGGSVTGAPKIRAVEIIDEIERVVRGPYCGCVGYLGFDGTMDTSIAIRTFVIKDQLLTFNTGGGIVADSRPHDEYLETLIKANALYKVLTGVPILSNNASGHFE